VCLAIACDCWLEASCQRRLGGPLILASLKSLVENGESLE
jgi:hypothetical protein